MPDEAWEVTSPAGVVHLTEGSGYTFCGKNCAPWENAGPDVSSEDAEAPSA
jgi:hypothetical protein